MGKLKDIMSLKGLSNVGEHLESLGYDDENKIYEMVKSNPNVWEELKMNSDTYKDDRLKLENIVNETTKQKQKQKQNSKNLKFVLGGLSIVFLLWIFGLFDGGDSDKGVHYAVTEHRLNGSTVYATAYVGYGINAQYCAQDIMSVAYSLMKNKYKNASSLVLEYGIKYTDKYGEKKKKLVGEFRPDVSTLRRYESSTRYSNGESGTAVRIMFEFQGKGFQ